MGQAAVYGVFFFLLWGHNGWVSHMTMLLLDSFFSSLCHTFLQKRQLILSDLLLFMELAGKQRQGLFFFFVILCLALYI